MTKSKSTFCRICEPFCPLVVDIDEEGKAVRLRPDTTHPSGGIACHKGLSFLEVHNDPDRVNWPLKRLNARSTAKGDFAQTDWDSALREIGQKVKALRAQFGENAVAVYYGNATISSSGAVTAIDPFRRALGTSMVFGANSQDATNKVSGAAAIYGSGAASPIPDLYHTDYLLCIGANPKVSRWTYMSVPNDDLQVLRNIRKRGGKVRFVNPRRIESSTEDTGPTLLIKPGTDVYFLAAVLNEIERLGGFDEESLARYGKNVEGLRAFISSYPPEAVVNVTGVDAEVIRTTAREILAAKSAAVYVGTGVNQSKQGVLGYWLAEMINFATGNLGKTGGMYKPAGLIDDGPPMAPPLKVETSIGSFEIPDITGYAVLPAVALPALINSGEVRALFVLSGNPILSVGGEAQMREAFAKLDLLVSIDIYRQATGEMADYILPSTDWLEHTDINLVPNTQQMIPYVQYTEAIEQPAAGRKNGWWILNKILQASELPSAFDSAEERDDAYEVIEGLLSMKGLSVDKMLALPNNTHVFEQEPRDAFLQKYLVHSDKKVDCCPDVFESSGLFERCADIFKELSSEEPSVLKLISLRTPYMQNSWLSNLGKFRHGRLSVNPLNMSEADAAARGLHDGDLVRVFNQHGSINAQILINTNLRPGAVAMTHGYGNQRTFGLGVASKKPGSNFNALMPIGPKEYEPLSYMAWVSGVPVEVEKVALSAGARASR